MNSPDSTAVAIRVRGASKCYQIYEHPQDRLKQALFRGRRRYYREFWALRGLDFEVHRGETVGIIGRNGSGKSTLLQLICGTLTPTAGEVQVNGRVAALLELGAGFNPEFSGRENVYMNAALLGLSRAEIDARIAAILAFADIGDFIDQPVKTYSSGMYVRLAFAVIAHVDADILIIDEALAVGDAFFTQKCMRFLRQFRKTGTLLFVSHDSGAVVNLCDRALWLQQGELVAIGAAKAVTEQYLASLFEEADGEVTAKEPVAAAPRVVAKVEDWRDQRLGLVNASPLRNDLQVFRFDPDASQSFGQGLARILDVRLTDADGVALNWVVGGEVVCLQVDVRALGPLDSPIVGFYVKDRLGQTLFGDNTYLSYADRPRSLLAGDSVRACFRFPMPLLPVGDYSIAVAVANGTQAEHVQHHWIHDALLFKSLSSLAATGLVGIPMLDISLESP